MADWEVFEHECAEYLRDRYAGRNVQVEEYGSNNAYLADIIVKGNGRSIPIETKMARAQSGQFVVGYDDGEDVEDRFFISNGCADSLSTAVQVLIDELNSDTERYLDLMATQGWAHVDVDEEVVGRCIAEHYRRTKGENHLITGHLGDGKMLIPMDCLLDYFRVGAVLRYKHSGPGPIAAYDQYNAQAHLDEHLARLRSSGKYGDLRVEGPLYRDGRHWHVAMDAVLERSDRYFGNDGYYLSPGRSGLYRAKRRGKTNSITVVFTLDLHPEKFAADTGFEVLDGMLR